MLPVLTRNAYSAEHTKCKTKDQMSNRLILFLSSSVVNLDLHFLAARLYEITDPDKAPKLNVKGDNFLTFISYFCELFPHFSDNYFLILLTIISSSLFLSLIFVHITFITLLRFAFIKSRGCIFFIMNMKNFLTL